jgi:hypothetical protein
MSGFNLPPGVSASDLPGNEPECERDDGMSANHTPGPWVAEPPDGRQRCWTVWDRGQKARGWDTWIAVLKCGSAPMEEAPNARLIAAAPELLFQLLAAANYIDALGGDSKSYRAAIAKATGEAG